MKKVIVALLIAAMAFSAFSAFAGGGGQQASPVSGPLTIEWLAYNQATGVLASSESEGKRLLEEKYNIRINIQTVNIHNIDQWNLYWAAGNMPHYANTNKASTETFKLLDQGIVRAIPDGWLDMYMPDWMNNVYISIPKETVYKQISANGKNYIIPYHGGIPAYALFLRQDWLDNLGITQLPNNNAELYEILRRFTFDDPDGNGRKDTYGIHASMGNQRFSYVTSSMGITPKAFRDVNGRVIFTDVTDEYKNHLKMLREWYAAGIVDPESFIEDRVMQRQKWAANTVGALGDSSWWFSATTPGNLVDMIREKVPNANVVQLAPFPDAQGRRLRPGPYPNCAGDGSSFFTTKATDDIIRKIMEFRNDQAKDVQFYLRMYYGIQGRDYDIVDGLLSPRPEAASPEYVTEKGLRQTFGITPMPYQITRNAGLNTRPDMELNDFMFQFDVFYNSGVNFVFPGINQAYSTNWPDINTMCDEYYANAITGKVDIDASFEAFKRSLNDAGLQAIINEYQAGISR